MLLIVLLQLLIVLPAIAGDNIPSNMEVEYAQKLYKLMSGFDQNEANFAKKIQTVNAQDNNSISALFKSKFNYTKQYYLSVSALQPTSKFAKWHRELLESIYNTLKCIQKVIIELKKNKSPQEILLQYNKTFKDINANYSKAVKEIVTIIKSWQKPYIKKVIPKNSPAS